MISWTRKAPVSDRPDVQALHADAVASVVRAESEVTRLAALVRTSSAAVAAAEARAADAIAAPDSNATSDADVMNAVAAARARRDAGILAHSRAVALVSEANAALPALERQLRRAAAEDDLATLQVDAAGEVAGEKAIVHHRARVLLGAAAISSPVELARAAAEAKQCQRGDADGSLHRDLGGRKSAHRSENRAPSYHAGLPPFRRCGGLVL